ncbi:hypothetical protein [Halorhodospira sp. 9622]|uniref:hypothetical protein n=1 Tax=Halorhodospira sp. 9622 TaxID=2899136 RepID=UPI001EE7CE4C|nr:hypothetical protein [Halorhodospira sp. 9622]MCG5538983.1 hypothetical protein [Halorhodospira sp. 9622]
MHHARIRLYRALLPRATRIAEEAQGRSRLTFAGNGQDIGVYDADTRECLGRVANSGEARNVLEIHQDLRLGELDTA